MGLAAFAGRGSADNIGARFDRLFGVEGAFAAGKALEQKFGVIR